MGRNLGPVLIAGKPEYPQMESHARIKMAQVLGSLVYICGLHLEHGLKYDISLRAFLIGYFHNLYFCFDVNLLHFYKHCGLYGCWGLTLPRKKKYGHPPP